MSMAYIIDRPLKDRRKDKCCVIEAALCTSKVVHLFIWMYSIFCTGVRLGTSIYATTPKNNKKVLYIKILITLFIIKQN